MLTHAPTLQAHALSLRRTIGSQRSCLPRPEADRLITAYMDSFNHINHIIDRDTFQPEYERFWLTPETADGRLIIVLLLLLSIDLCSISTDADFYGFHGSSARDKASANIQACQDWLQARVPAFQTEADFHISFLLLFACRVNARKYKQTWANAGKVIRNFMCAGLHQDISSPERHFSSKVKEARARLWASIAEFELQASFEQGMPAPAWPQQATARAPKNIRNLDEDAEADWSLPEFTPSSYLSYAGRSLLLRHCIVSRFHDHRCAMGFEETQSLSEEIYQELEQLPQWTESQAQLPNALLTITLNQYLLALHLRQARRATTRTERRIFPSTRRLGSMSNRVQYGLPRRNPSPGFAIAHASCSSAEVQPFVTSTCAASIGSAGQKCRFSRRAKAVLSRWEPVKPSPWVQAASGRGKAPLHALLKDVVHEGILGQTQVYEA